MRNGTPKPRLISNTFEPIALLKLCYFKFLDSNRLHPIDFAYLTAISPNPSLATKTDEIASGIDVPTAMMTRPIVKWLISKIAPKCSTHSNIPNEMATIHKIAMVKDTRYHLRVSGVPHGGIVKVYRT